MSKDLGAMALHRQELAAVRRECVKSLRTAGAAAQEELAGMAIDCQALIDELKAGYAAAHSAALWRGVVVGMTIGAVSFGFGFLLAAL